MAKTKKDNGWFMPSFDIDTEKPIAFKRPRLQKIQTNAACTSSTSNIFQERKRVDSLSELLQACEPKKSSELAISRQKQQEISDWLQFKAQKGPTALILTGPSGCGKTAGIKLLAKENDFDVIEWINPIDQLMDENNRTTRQGDRFIEYMVRATRYNSVLSSYSKRLLLVKDLPNVYYENKEDFYDLLKMYFEMGREPIVFICTESGTSRILQTLFPPHIKEKYDITAICINPATQVAMKNMLKRVSEILNTIASHILSLTQDKINEILCNSIGDVRSSILNLIFISLKVPVEQEKNECGSREESLGLLHGVGRVINPKRVNEGNSWKFVHDPDNIAFYFQSHGTVFLQFLHENYLNTMRFIEDASISADILSFGDILNSEWRNASLSKIALSFYVRGLMVSNTNPLNKWNPVRKPQSNQTVTHRCLDIAEIQWYQSLIKSNRQEVKESPNTEIDGVIIE